MKVSKCIWVYEMSERSAKSWLRCPGCGAASPGPGMLWTVATGLATSVVCHRSVCCGVFIYTTAGRAHISFKEPRG